MKQNKMSKNCLPFLLFAVTRAGARGGGGARPTAAATVTGGAAGGTATGAETENLNYYTKSCMYTSP